MSDPDMNCKNIFIPGIILVSFLFTLICGFADSRNNDLIKVLILSGKNNHEWHKTTPLLVKMYEDSRLFKINVTEKPDTLTYNEFKKYDVVVSNWNTWPDNDYRMQKEWEDDFLKYVMEGGGSVFIHAGASSFYKWNEYRQIGIGRWGKETSHGNQTRARVNGFDKMHPITKGLRDFYIMDEIWEKPDIFSGATTLATVTATDENNGHRISSPSVIVNHIGKGRSFFTILGHNERALLNRGLQTILLRATQWTANREVNIGIPSDLKDRLTYVTNNFRWAQSDTTLGLMNNQDIMWQYNFNNRFGKPYFHPVAVNYSTLTCLSPPDHPWHLGLWFSWKFINGVNYWEYLNDFKSEETGYKSAGVTRVKKTGILKNADFSSDIRMELEYFPADSNIVMNEKRIIHISRPTDDGSYYMDNEFIFEPLVDEVVLDRTPVEGEPEGQSWGGYSGLSVRFSQDLTSPEIIVPSDSITYRKNNWLYMGFNTLNGEKAGICILRNPKFTTPASRWYVINNPEIPFFYYSPAAIFDGRFVLKKGELLHLKYRVWIIPGKTGKNELRDKYDEYLQDN